MQGLILTLIITRTELYFPSKYESLEIPTKDQFANTNKTLHLKGCLAVWSWLAPIESIQIHLIAFTRILDHDEHLHFSQKKF